MKMFLMNVLLAIIWAELLGDFSFANLVFGFGLGYVALWMMRDVVGSSSYYAKVPQVIRFVSHFFWELTKSNIQMAYYVLVSNHKMRPGIIAIPLDITTDIQITMLANMITLTPGTLSLDVSTDRKVLYVHSVYISDPEEFVRGIKEGFERRILEVTQ